ncbi:MAG: phosphodiesterase [Firmicutes bacterium]|nr:phosphodiesterase [Bacillota bacterium]MBQ2058792.1 phosphodiesterase [Bacillota bacterium]
MKLMIASDIHGSAVFCEKLLERFEDEAPERLLLLGDILYSSSASALEGGSDTRSVFGMLNAYADQIMAVRGNCDSDVDQTVLDFPITSDYIYLPWDGRMIFATHGHVYGPHRLPPVSSCDLLLCGHTHIPDFYQVRTPGEGGPGVESPCYYCNPGSVSLPKGGSSRSYMTLEDGVLRWKTLDGEVYREERI